MLQKTQKEKHALKKKKEDSLNEFQKTNQHIPPNWNPEEVEAEVDAIFEEEPFKTLLSNQKGSFYVLFARSDLTHEGTGFLQKRGGDYFSKSKQKTIYAKKSRPILLKKNGSVITASEFKQSGYTTVALREGFNPTRFAALETRLQERTMPIPLGRRLHRSPGRAKWADDTAHMKFGVYLTYRLDGVPSQYVVQ